MEPLITICIVNYNSSDFILNTLYCLEILTKNNYKIIIRDNNSRINDYQNLEKLIVEYSNIELYRIDCFSYTGSIAHGIAINDLIRRITTKYGVVLDADCTFLHKNWDEILINEIDEDYPIIGAQVANSSNKKPLDFPGMYAFLFYTDIMKKLNIDFRPLDPANYTDTGYQLRQGYLKKGYKGKLLIFRNTRYYKNGPLKKVICVEYYLEGYDEIFASHFGRGSTLGKSKYKKGWKRYFYGFPIIGSYLLTLKGKKEKRKWIKGCKKIVDEKK